MGTSAEAELAWTRVDAAGLERFELRCDTDTWTLRGEAWQPAKQRDAVVRSHRTRPASPALLVLVRLLGNPLGRCLAAGPEQKVPQHLVAAQWIWPGLRRKRWL